MLPSADNLNGAVREKRRCARPAAVRVGVLQCATKGFPSLGCMQRFPLLDQNRVTTFATASDSPNTMTAVEIGLPIKVCWRAIPTLLPVL